MESWLTTSVWKMVRLLLIGCLCLFTMELSSLHLRWIPRAEHESQLTKMPTSNVATPRLRYNFSTDYYRRVVENLLRDNTSRVAAGAPRRWTSTGEVFIIPEDTTEYFKSSNGSTCFVTGTRLASNGACVCLAGWHGSACSVPESVWASNMGEKALQKLIPRIGNAPKKVIHAFPFNIEFEMLEARFVEYAEVVDVFLILESNFTAHGERKPLHLLDRLEKGMYGEYAHKIVHVFLDTFAKGGLQNGWLEDNLLRDHLSQHGLKNQLSNYSSEDLFFLTDADELPRRDTVAFLKLHDNYPEPIGHHLTPLTFGFYWQGKRGTLHIITTVSVGVLTGILHNRAISIRSAPAHLKAPFMNTYLKSHRNAQLRLWSFGNKRSSSGWHCSWCCETYCIRDKLFSAQNGDFPRWGDYPEKGDLTYLKYLVQTGMWFDNVGRLSQRPNTTLHYAPSHMLENREKYQHLLQNPFTQVKLNISHLDISPFSNKRPR